MATDKHLETIEEQPADESFVNISTTEEEVRTRATNTGCGKYRRGLKTLLPIRCEKSPNNILPLDHLGLVSYSSYGWMTPIIWRVYKSGLDSVRSLGISHQESAQRNADRMEKIWNEELKQNGEEKASYGKTVVQSFKTRILIGFLFSLVFAFFSIANPLLVIQYFLEYISEDEVSMKTGIKYALLLGLIIALRAFTEGFFFMLNFEAAARIKNGTLALLYRKVIKVKNLQGKSTGDIVNFITNDGQRIWDGIVMGPFIIGAPVVMIGSLICSTIYLGPWALIGWLVIFLFYPFSGALAQKSQELREASIKITDKRVGLMSELLTCIKLIKMYAWESSFVSRILAIRQEEKAVLEKSDLLQSVALGSSMLVPFFACTLTFIGYVGSGNNLTPTQAFTFMSLLNTVQFSMLALPFAMKSIADMTVSLTRMKEILLLDEIKPHSPEVTNPSLSVELQSASFSWTSHKQPSTDKKDVPEDEETRLAEPRDEETHIFTGPTLKDISCTVKKGNLVGVCGSVGCGKSSLVNAILGRMELTSGSVAVSEDLAYVPQQAWITNNTIKDNILFGGLFEPDRYKRVIEACALVDDFSTFTSGDMTEVGERGTTLSGGQKQRVSLARAAYSSSNLVVLDDPLSSVDVHVGQHIFSQCILDLLKTRTVIFVTHQLQYLEHCDDVIVMKDGMVAEQGPPTRLFEKGGEYTSLLNNYNRQGEITSNIEDHSKDESSEDKEGETTVVLNTETADDSVAEESTNLLSDSTMNESVRIDVDDMKPVLRRRQTPDRVEQNKGKSDRLVEEEDLESGSSVTRPVLHNYIRAFGGYLVFILVFVCFSLPVAGLTTAGWYLSYWLQQGAGGANMSVGNTSVPSMRVVDNPDLNSHLTVYGCFIPILVVAMILRSVAIIKSTLAASSSMHRQAFHRILNCSMSFFNSTPVGRILNRFSADLDECDTKLPMNLEIFLTNSLQILATLIIIAYVSPWFLVAVVPLSLLFFFIMGVFHTAIRDIKRLDNVSRSPVISHLTTTIHGLTSINAYQRNQDFIQTHCELLNANTVAVFLFYAANRWLALRLDLVSALVIFITGLLILLTFDHLNPALAGLALSYAIQLSGLFQFMSRMAVETEARFTSVQRIQLYSRLEDQEVVKHSDVEIPESWPKTGSIKFHDVCLRYRPGLSLALKSVTFEVQPLAKIGIVGRSGAGKTSLCTALFRLAALEKGSITISDLDISQVPLERLRSQVTVIPQDPELFSGDLRYNLDPLNKYSDSELWGALEKCFIADMVESLENELHANVEEKGANFSVGERQLICMSRALLRHTKILVLDEATAAIDSQTDSMIQRALSESFSDCTMLIIAHRLATVKHCDKILLLETGQVLEFDSPSKLVSDPNSKFRAMLNATGELQAFTS